MTLLHLLISFVRQQFLRANDRNQPRFRAIRRIEPGATSLLLEQAGEWARAKRGLEIIAKLATGLAKWSRRS
jgi:hypothetical protein